jgi:hypothetical protein
LAWGLANFFTVLNEVHALEEQQSNRYAEKSKRLAEIIQTAEVALSLGHDNGAGEENIFKGYDTDLHANLVEHYKLSYSLILIPTKDTQRKLTGSGWKKSSEFDINLLQQISSSKDQQLLFDQFGNLVLIRTINDPHRGFFLQLKLSTQSLGRVLGIKAPQFIHADVASVNGNDDQTTFKIPINDEWLLVFSEPEISFMKEYLWNLSNNGVWIAFLILASAIASMIFYGLLAIHIAKNFKDRIQNQENVIVAVTSELSQSNDKFAYTENKLFATQLQIKAEHSFLTYIKMCTLEGPLQPNVLSALDNLKNEPPRLAIVKNQSDPKENIPVVNADQESSLLEKIDMIEALGDVLNCFEVCQFEKNMTLNVNAEDISTEIMTNPVAVKVLLYNILNRIFSRSKGNGNLQIEFTKNKGLLIASFLDDGFSLGIDHSSYFEDTTSLSSHMLSWKRVVSTAHSEGMMVAYEQLSLTQFQTTLEAHIKPIPTTSREGCNNVVPLFK